ncbi:MAG: ATP-binding protein [Candidatus Izimaplasma sp.]|nr:ATP-binding protein [Candidatus Izimaplasma bacterium]
MKIAILSGKGGTGKTTLSVNLFSYLNKATLIDTDVEEPNSHLFLKGKVIKEKSIIKHYPKVNDDLCDYCGKCGDFCNFNAIIPAKKKVLVFQDLCHDCGGCSLVCPKNAITYVDKEIGKEFHIQVDENKLFLYGNLTIGEVSGVRIIESLKETTKNEDLLLIDSPPGTSCSTVAAIDGTDYCIICAEATPFGLSDMKMVVELLRAEGRNFGVVVNKCNLGNDEIYHYLEEEKIELLEKIKFDREFASIMADGELLINHSQYFKDKISNIARKVLGDKYDQ